MKRSCNRGALIIFVLALAFAGAAKADTVSLGPKKDNTIYSESQYTNGGGQHFFVGTTLHNYYRRSLISFDVSSNVPAGSTIQSVTLQLHMSMTNTLAHATNVSLHRCLAPWGEGTAVGLLGEGGGLVCWSQPQQHWATISLRQMLRQRSDPASPLRA